MTSQQQTQQNQQTTTKQQTSTKQQFQQALRNQIAHNTERYSQTNILNVASKQTQPKPRNDIYTYRKNSINIGDIVEVYVNELQPQIEFGLEQYIVYRGYINLAERLKETSAEIDIKTLEVTIKVPLNEVSTVLINNSYSHTDVKITDAVIKDININNRTMLIELDNRK